MKNVVEVQISEEAVGGAVFIPQGIEGSPGIHANRHGRIRKIAKHNGRTILIVRLEATSDKPAQDLILVS